VEHRKELTTIVVRQPGHREEERRDRTGGRAASTGIRAEVRGRQEAAQRRVAKGSVAEKEPATPQRPHGDPLRKEIRSSDRFTAVETVAPNSPGGNGRIDRALTKNRNRDGLSGQNEEPKPNESPSPEAAARTG
jgi:hypothetical protein